jgi:hypothetical protein
VARTKAEYLRVSLALTSLTHLSEILQDRIDVYDDTTVTFDVDELRKLIEPALQYLFDRRKVL